LTFNLKVLGAALPKYQPQRFNITPGYAILEHISTTLLYPDQDTRPIHRNDSQDGSLEKNPMTGPVTNGCAARKQEDEEGRAGHW
jgi:hypothetical protein